MGGREVRRAQMAAVGFEEAKFGGKAVETAKALLRKYDVGWDLVPPSPAFGGGGAPIEGAAHVGLLTVAPSVVVVRLPAGP